MEVLVKDVHHIVSLPVQYCAHMHVEEEIFSSNLKNKLVLLVYLTASGYLTSHISMYLKYANMCAQYAVMHTQHANFKVLSKNMYVKGGKFSCGLLHEL